MTLKQKGFSLVELLVSVAVVTLILSVILYNYQSLNSSIILSSNVQQLLIFIRKAQTYGLSVKEAGVGTGNFSYAYGIDITTSSVHFITLFIDKNGNGIYDPG